MTHIEQVISIAIDYDQYDNLHWWRDEEDGQIKVGANCSDLFWWATADAEEITPDNIQLFEETCNECEALDDGIEFPTVFACALFAARARKMRPQGAYYKMFPRSMWPMFNACGPERETGLGNPVTPEQSIENQSCSTPVQPKSWWQKVKEWYCRD